jgi:hypothetical protein
LVEPDTVAWNPPADTPHPMLYNPVTTRIMYSVDEGNKTKPQTVKTNMDMIDYNRHNIVTVFGRPPENMKVVKDNAEIAVQIKDAAKEAFEETANVDETGDRQEETMGLRAVVASFSLETAILDMRVEMMAKVDRDNPPMIFQAYAQIFTALIGNKSEYDLIHKFADSSSYIELREKVRAAVATASPELITTVTMKLTRLMNEILTDRLSILPPDKDPMNGVEVEDFLEDIDQLFDYLKKRGDNGERMYKAFIDGSGRRIKSMFHAPDLTTEAGKRLHDSLTSNLLTTSWTDREDLPEFTFFGPTVRVTFLNVVSHDLLIAAGNPHVANVITRLHSAVLYNVAESLFKVDTGDVPVDRQLVVTKDGRIMEIIEGALVPNTYLFKLVK